jgi:HEAT repeat protein
MTPFSNVQYASLPGAVTAAAAVPVDELLAGIASDDDDVRTSAWLRAGDVGASAIVPLAALTGNESMEVARAASRGMWRIVRHCGGPGAGTERQAVSTALAGLLADDQSVSLRREVLWMLSEIGGDDFVAPISALLSNVDLREDARMTLERIPGDASLAALESALDAVPEDFKLNIAQSLRQRGVEVSGHPCAKLVPVKQTEVTAL